MFTFNLKDDLPIFGDQDVDLERHMEAFADVCAIVKPSNARERLRVFGRTLTGTRRKCYDTIIKEAKATGEHEDKPALVFDRVVAALDASFHETDEAKAMKARAKFDHLEKRERRSKSSKLLGWSACPTSTLRVCISVRIFAL